MAFLIKKHRVIAPILLSLFFAGGFFFLVRAATQDQNLVGRWIFDEAAGTVSADVSGNGNNAAFVNNPLWTSGKNGSALYYQPTSYTDMGSPASGLFDFGAGQGFTVGAWVKMNLSGNPSILISKGPAACSNCGSGFELITRPTSISFLVDTNGTTLGTFEASVATTTHVDGKWHYIAGVRDGATLNLYIDGKKEATAANDNGSVINSSARLTVGGRGSAFTATNTVIDEVSVYNRAFSDQDMFALFNRVSLPLSGYAWSSNVGWVKFSGIAKNLAPYGVFIDNITGDFSGDAWSSNVGWLSFDRFETGAPPTELSNAPPVGSWRLNEILGLVASDDSGNGNNGTLSGGPLWVSGRDGNALSFDGIDDFVTVPHNSIFNFGAGPLTLSAWVKTTDNAGSIITKGADPALTLIVIPGGLVKFSIYFSVSSPAEEKVISVTRVNDGVYHQIVGVRDGVSLLLYIDGRLDASASMTNSKSIDSTWPLNINQGVSDLNANLTGIIDDVLVYNRALAADEILANFKETPLPQPAAYWKFDEAPLATPAAYWKFDETTGAVASDSSGNSHPGTLSCKAPCTTATLPQWTTPGKVGGALTFDGVDDYVNLGDLSTYTHPLTISFWYYLPDSTPRGETFLANANPGTIYPYYVFHPSGFFHFYYPDYRASPNILSLAPRWIHIAYVTDPTSLANWKTYVNGVLQPNIQTDSGTPVNFDPIGTYLGGSNFNMDFLKGSIDELRIYTRALAPAEIRALSGALDSSGNGNAGTAVGGVTSGADGILGKGLKFNGANGYVRVNDAAALDMGASNWTVSGWIKHSSTTATRGVAAKRNFTLVNNPGYQIQLQSDNRLWAYFSDGSASRISLGSTDVFADDTWHHFAVVFNRAGNMVIYRDGVANGSVSIAAQQGDASNAEPLYIGAVNSGSPASFFGGFIDDVHIYNRALTKDEVFGSFQKVNPTIARLNASTNLIDGWARFLSGTDGGWDGWVKFFGTGYTVLRDGIDLKGYAWGDKVVGWMSFNGTASDGSPYGVTIGKTNPNFTAMLTVTPASGAEPLSGVEMKVQAFNFSSDPARIKFDCEDDGAYEYITPSPVDLSNPLNNPYTSPFKCTYLTAGMYHPKVVIEQISGLFGSVAEATADVTVLPALAVYGAPFAGYAWSSNVGWIKFAGKTTANVPYGVFADARTGEMSGYAWSGNTATVTQAPIRGDLNADGVVTKDTRINAALNYNDLFTVGTDEYVLFGGPGFFIETLSSPHDPVASTSPRYNPAADFDNDGYVDVEVYEWVGDPFNRGFNDFYYSKRWGTTDYDIFLALVGNTGVAQSYTDSGGIGWIDFAPAGPYPEPPNFSARLTGPKLDTIEGWARACAVFQNGCSGGLNVGRGGWDGWIKLTGDTQAFLDPLVAIYPASTSPSGVAFDASGNLWTTNGSLNQRTSVTKVMPDGTAITYVQPGATGLRNIASDGANLWAANGVSSGGIYKIAPDGSSVRYGVGSNPSRDILFDGTNIWVLTGGLFGPAAVNKIDPGTGATLGTTLLPSNSNYGFGSDTNNKNVWVGELVSGYALTRVTSAGVTTTWNGLGLTERFVSFRPDYISFGGGNIWVSMKDSRTFMKVDPMTGATSTFLFSMPANMTGGPMTFDNSGDMWITSNGAVARLGISPGQEGQVKLFFTSSTYPGAFAGAISGGIGFDGANIWTANNTGNSVSKIFNLTPSTYSYGLTVSSTTDRVEGFAWGNNVIGWINFCDTETNLYCVTVTGLGKINSMVFQAIPKSGKKPLNDVDLKVVLDTPTPGIPTTYTFDCNINDATVTPDLVAPDIVGGTYTAVDLCDYPNAGTYTAQVIVDQAGTTQTATTKIIAFPSDFREIPPS